MNLSPPHSQDVATNTLSSNATACERNITDVMLMVSQDVTDVFNASVNLADPYYIR